MKKLEAYDIERERYREILEDDLEEQRLMRAPISRMLSDLATIKAENTVYTVSQISRMMGVLSAFKAYYISEKDLAVIETASPGLLKKIDNTLGALSALKSEMIDQQAEEYAKVKTESVRRNSKIYFVIRQCRYLRKRRPAVYSHIKRPCKEKLTNKAFIHTLEKLVAQEKSKGQ